MRKVESKEYKEAKELVNRLNTSFCEVAKHINKILKLLKKECDENEKNK